MAKLPESWGLKTKRRNDGRLDIVGKDDSGRDYVARTTAHSDVTQRDVAELAAVDRERYANREAGAKSIVSGIIDRQEKRNATRERAFEEDCYEGAQELLAQPGVLEGRAVSFGYSRSYSRNYERVFAVTDRRRTL
jgi:hypothetical protein